MISNLIVLIVFSAIVSLGVCVPLNLPSSSKELYKKCSPNLVRFKTFISCEQELKPIRFHVDALNYVCLLSFNLILEACKQDMLSRIDENVDTKFSNQTCPINYVAKYYNLDSDLSEGIGYLRDREHCESVCNMNRNSSQKCIFLNQVIKVLNENDSGKVKTTAADNPVSSVGQMRDDLTKPQEISPVNGERDLKSELNNDLPEKNVQSDRMAGSNIRYQLNKTEALTKKNSTIAKGEKSNSTTEIRVNDNKKETNVDAEGSKISNNEKNTGQKTLDDSPIESQDGYNFPGKNDEQDPMSMSNPVDTNAYTMQTEPGALGVLANKNYNLNNHDKDYRMDGDPKVLADEGGGGDDDDDDNGPAAFAAAISNAANSNNNNKNNNINDDELDKSSMQDALPDREPPQLSKSINSKEIYSSDNFFQAEDSHFSTYFLMTISLIIIGYIIYHNKNKIVAYALEGRRNRNGRRRAASSASYRKLDCNLEEAIASNPSHASVTNVVY